MSDEYPPFMVSWEDKNITLTPVSRQDYENCFFEAGIAEGHPTDALYLRLGRTNEEPSIIFLRPDEMMALIWCMSGTVWSTMMSMLEESNAGQQTEAMESDLREAEGSTSPIL